MNKTKKQRKKELEARRKKIKPLKKEDFLKYGNKLMSRAKVVSDPYISCWKIHQFRTDIPECCESCHVDHDEFGYDLCAVDGPDGSIGRHSGGVCCTVSLYLDKNPLTRAEWDQLERETE